MGFWQIQVLYHPPLEPLEPQGFGGFFVYRQYTLEYTLYGKKCVLRPTPAENKQLDLNVNIL